MPGVFPEELRQLPQADIPLEGAVAYLLQGADCQMLFCEYAQDARIPAHAHESQWGVVLEGSIEFTVDGVHYVYTKGQRYYIPKGVVHSSYVHAGYADVLFFAQRDRFKAKAV